MKRIAVVILNWNGQKLLEQFLPSVIRFSPEATIYVADNASDDLSVELLRIHFPMVKVIRNIANYGFAQGYNEALKHVEEEIYALVNSDVEVTQNWLVPVLELFDHEPQTSIVQPKILDFKRRDHFEYAGAAGGFIDRFGYPFCRGRIFETIERDLGQYDDLRKIFWASGACFFIRKQTFRELGGFDKDFFAHQEEIDLCWRANNRGYQVMYCGNSTVYHVGGATLNSSNPRKTYLNFRNSLFLLVKNLPKNKLVPIIFSRLILDGAAGILFFLQGKSEHTTAVARAHFDFYASAGKMLRRRKAVQKHDYFASKNIAYQYFIKKQRFFRN